MNINPIDFSYIDGKNTYPIIDYIDDNLEVTSNILTSEIDYTSNILNTKINYINTNNINYTNALRTDISKLIEEKTENILLPIPAILTHIYIHNSNLAGEIRFFCQSANSFPTFNLFGIPDYRVKIDLDGKLKCWYNYDPLVSLTYFSGWVDIVTSIVQLNAADANISITLTGLGAETVYLQKQINEIPYALGLVSGLSQNNQQVMRDLVTTCGSDAINAPILTQVYDGITVLLEEGKSEFLFAAFNRIGVEISRNTAIGVYLGVGGIAFAAIVGAITNLSYANTVLAQIEKNITSNINISSNVKVQLLSSNQDEKINTYINYASNLYDISYYQGFLNSNTVSTQFINDLRVNNLNANNASIDNLDVNNATIDNLDVNNGNITNINNIQTNNINANFGIFSNITIISTIYASSNDVINIAQQQPTYFKKLNITIPNTRFSYDGVNSLFYYDLNIQQYIPYSTYGSFKYRNFRISTFVENTDWIGGRNLKDTFGNYYNNPEPLTFYCNNAQNISGIINPNDSYHNCIILGKSINTNIANWSAVANNFNYIRYLTRIGWDMQIVLEQLN